MSIKIITLLLFVLICVSGDISVAADSGTVLLTEDTMLYPQGVVNGLVLFKGGTEVVLNDNGKVVNGILKDSALLWFKGAVLSDMYFLQLDEKKNQIQVKGAVAFDKDGYIIKAILLNDTNLLIKPSRDAYVRLGANSEVELYEDGSISSGVLKDDTLLRPIGYSDLMDRSTSSGYLMFKGNTKVSFDNEGYVSQGTITTDYAIINSLIALAGNPISFPLPYY